jgi:hypothetical protein
MKKIASGATPQETMTSCTSKDISGVEKGVAERLVENSVARLRVMDGLIAEAKAISINHGQICLAPEMEKD